MTARIFHYTIGNYLPSILTEGLRLATVGVAAFVRPAVWFSTEPFWEQTANKRGMINGEWGGLDRIETERRYGGLVRIEVGPEAAPYRWKDYEHLSGETRSNLKALKRSARANGANPAMWHVSFDPVPPSKFVTVEVLLGLRWVESRVEASVRKEMCEKK